MTDIPDYLIEDVKTLSKEDDFPITCHYAGGWDWKNQKRCYSQFESIEAYLEHIRENHRNAVHMLDTAYIYYRDVKHFEGNHDEYKEELERAKQPTINSFTEPNKKTQSEVFRDE